MENITDSYGRDLDLNLLRVFAVVAEEGSLTRAASRLYVTQPAISASMRRLAAFVGVELITRQGHGVVLTTRGTELLSAARAHLPPLVAATMAEPLFDPKRSTATIRVGLADCLEAVLLPKLLAQLRTEAPRIQLVVIAVQFRTVEEMLLSNKIDFAVTVADDLPRSILRRSLGERQSALHAFVCLYDPRFTKLARPLTERWYFAQDHVAVSYAGDVRGIVEDSLGKSRTVRVSVPAFGYVTDVVDGSSLVATVPRHFAVTPPPSAS
jgi:LysR family transcriptional regulator, mexEF-oprN operon transcriptional activator